MASKIDLISNALILIGDLPINTFIGNERRKVVARNLYDNIIENELTKHRWGFARRQGPLSLLTASPESKEWQKAYQLPSDMLSLITLYPSINYQLYGKQIYCNYNQILHADYIWKVPEDNWPPYFSKMIEYALAKDFASSIRDSATSKQAMAEEYLMASRMARYTDSQQHPQVAFRDRPFISVRS
jgi:hypothetical protein